VEKDKKMSLEYTKEFKDRIIGIGADIVDIADVEPLKKLKLNPPDLLDPFTRAVSIGLKLPAAAFEQITDSPTPIYKSIYQTANLILDQIAFRTFPAAEIKRGGSH